MLVFFIFLCKFYMSVRNINLLSFHISPLVQINYSLFRHFQMKCTLRCPFLLLTLASFSCLCVENFNSTVYCERKYAMKCNTEPQRGVACTALMFSISTISTIDRLEECSFSSILQICKLKVVTFLKLKCFTMSVFFIHLGKFYTCLKDGEEEILSNRVMVLLS